MSDAAIESICQAVVGIAGLGFLAFIMWLVFKDSP